MPELSSSGLARRRPSLRHAGELRHGDTGHAALALAWARWPEPPRHVTPSTTWPGEGAQQPSLVAEQERELPSCTPPRWETAASSRKQPARMEELDSEIEERQRLLHTSAPIRPSDLSLP